jgi:hypothetical protein
MRLSSFPPQAALLLGLVDLSRCDYSTAPTISASVDLSSPVSSMTPTVSPNETSLFTSNTGLQDAIEAWEKNETCDYSFFQYSVVQSREESKYAEFYNDVIGHLSTENPQRYHALGEVGSFFDHFLNERNFECSMQNNGCRVEYHCDDIVHKLNKTFRARGVYISPAQLLVDARKGWSSSKVFALAALRQCVTHWKRMY